MVTKPYKTILYVLREFIKCPAFLKLRLRNTFAVFRNKFSFQQTTIRWIRRVCKARTQTFIMSTKFETLQFKHKINPSTHSIFAALTRPFINIALDTNLWQVVSHTPNSFYYTPIMINDIIMTCMPAYSKASLHIIALLMLPAPSNNIRLLKSSI